MTSRATGRVASSLRGDIRVIGDGRLDADLLDSFVVHKDSQAFAELVSRHGPMVLGVCLRVLGNRHDAEDAFQAVFLVLARKAGSVSPRGQVGNWLYGVACRTAAEARRILIRRRSKERPMTDTPMLNASVETTWTEELRVLDEELSRLSQKYRTPVILCDLEGRTREAAARELGVPVGTLSGRLTTARRMLADRLTRRGVKVPVAVLLASPFVGSRVVARAVESATARTGAEVAAEVAILTERVLKTMFLIRARVIVAGALLLAGCGYLTSHLAAAKPGTTAAAPVPPPAAATKPAKDLAALERMLHGTWASRGFIQQFTTYRADGTFESAVLNEKSEGTWDLTWDALPPTLTLKYTKSFDPKLAGKTYTMKLLRLDDKFYAVENPGGMSLITLTRVKNQPPPK